MSVCDVAAIYRSICNRKCPTITSPLVPRREKSVGSGKLFLQNLPDSWNLNVSNVHVLQTFSNTEGIHYNIFWR